VQWWSAISSDAFLWAFPSAMEWCFILIQSPIIRQDLLFWWDLFFPINASLNIHTFLPFSTVSGGFILLIANAMMFLYIQTSKAWHVLNQPGLLVVLHLNLQTLIAILLQVYCPASVKYWIDQQLWLLQPIASRSLILLFPFFFILRFMCFLQLCIIAILLSLLTKFIVFATE